MNTITRVYEGQSRTELSVFIFILFDTCTSLVRLLDGGVLLLFVKSISGPKYFQFFKNRKFLKKLFYILRYFDVSVLVENNSNYVEKYSLKRPHSNTITFYMLHGYARVSMNI